MIFSVVICTVCPLSVYIGPRGVMYLSPMSPCLSYNFTKKKKIKNHFSPLGSNVLYRLDFRLFQQLKLGQCVFTVILCSTLWNHLQHKQRTSVSDDLDAADL